MCGQQTSKLCQGSFRPVNDETHQEQGEGKVFRIKGDDEESHLARGIFLGKGVGVCERQSREESVGIQ